MVKRKRLSVVNNISMQIIDDIGYVFRLQIEQSATANNYITHCPFYFISAFFILYFRLLLPPFIANRSHLHFCIH